MEHKMSIVHNSFVSIKAGKKKVYMRLYDGKRQAVRPNDTIVFKDIQNGELMSANVESIHIFPTFNELYAYFPKNELGYDEHESANPTDMLAYFDQKDQVRHGVVGFIVTPVQ